MKIKATIVSIQLLFLSLLISKPALSQLKGDRLLGGTGLDVGSQAPAQTISFLVPLYFYNTTSLRDKNGDVSVGNPNLNMFVTGLGLNVVTNFKILNANYGATVLLPFAKNRIEGNNTNSKSPFAYSDTYIVPLQLGWKTKTADYIFSYGLYVPTGKYALGASDNSGVGMLANELAAGTTIRLDSKGTISFATLISYELHSKKKDTDIKTGDIVSFEGGLGKSWYMFKGGKVPSSIIKAGAVYYMQFKATGDKIPVQNTVFEPGKDHVYALGLESSILFTKPKLLLGLRWFDEFGAVNRFQGNTLFVTLAHVLSLGHKSE